MGSYHIMQTTSNRVVYNKARKLHLEHTGKINCAYCPYNKGENSNRIDKRNWKRYRRYQWRN